MPAAFPQSQVLAIILGPSSSAHSNRTQRRMPRKALDRLQRLTSGNSIGIILSETLVGERRWLVGNTGTSTDVSANANEEEGDEETKKAKQGDGGIERDRDGYDEGARRNEVTGWLWIYVKMMVRSYSVFGLYPSKYVAWNWSEPFIVHSLVCSLSQTFFFRFSCV